MMRVLTDYHHADLAESLHMLFGDRFGMEVYHPIGQDWFDQWVWGFGRMHLGDALAQQFLGLDDRYTLVGDHYEGRDNAHPERLHRFVTLDQFHAMDGWAYIVASVPDNEMGFAKLARMSGAQYVVQVGNTSQPVHWSLDPLALVSSEMPIEGRGVRYHQEFDSDGTFRFRRLSNGFRIASFVNCFPLMHTYGTWQTAHDLLPGYGFAEHGIDGRDGNLNPTSVIAERMAECGFGWHDKEHGDGFGHVIHQWAAIGRPLIGHASHYAGRMAEPLWEDGVTCIDLDRHTLREAVALIEEIAHDRDRHYAMCRAIRARFDELVDYDREAQMIADLLGTRVAVAA